MVFSTKCPYCEKANKYRMDNDDVRKICDDVEMLIKCKCSDCHSEFIHDGLFVERLRKAAMAVM